MKVINYLGLKFPYLITEYGDIYKNGDKLKPHIDHNGYLQIRLTTIDKKRKSFLVHRLVALTYIPNIKNKETVNHIDGNKLNNHISNLEWMTLLENTNDAKRLGHNGNYTDITTELINNIISELQLGNSVKSICIKYNCSKNFVSRIRQNKRHRELKREIISISRKLSLQQKKEICYLILNRIKDKKINDYYNTCKNYCYSIRKGKSHKQIMSYIINNNFEPSTTIKNYFNL